MFIYLGCLLITIIVHELAHMLVALKCGVGVEAFSIGFGKPMLHKKFKGIDFRITPWLIGGYCKLKGENRKLQKDDFLAQRYSKKFAILIAGVAVNFALACICYWINYGSISMGIKVDLLLMKSIFLKDYTTALMTIVTLKPNLFLLQLSLFNLFCAIFNLLPFPALDGGTIWLLLFEKVWKKNFVKILNLISTIGFITLMVIQAYIIWMFFLT